MPEVRDCPLCGGSMQLKVTTHIVRLPGNPKDTTSNTAEWVCPDCDYFEEAEGD
jgi:YgiT-type zinc finger domain-containing protein